MSAMSITDETFEAARLGDRDAVMRLLQRVQPDIRRYARASCRSSADSEDAAQQAPRHVGSIRPSPRYRRGCTAWSAANASGWPGAWA